MTIETIVKNGLYIPALLVGAGLPQEGVTALMILVFLDFITGIAKSGIIYGWHSIKSSRGVAGVLSKVMVIVAPYSLAVANNGLGINLEAVIKTIMTMLILSELYSILGNIRAINTKQEVPEFDGLSFILKKIQKALLKLMELDKK